MLQGVHATSPIHAEVEQWRALITVLSDVDYPVRASEETMDQEASSMDWNTPVMEKL